MTDDAEFVFVGEDAAFDLVNTEVVVRGRHQELLSDVDAVSRWWHEVVQQHTLFREIHGLPETWNESMLASCKAFRAVLRQFLTAIIDGRTPDANALHAMNAILELAQPTVRVDHVRLVQSVYQFRGENEQNVLFPFALSALRLVTERERDRLRRCHNERCIMLFYDTTKSRTRQWCSPACLERERSIQRYRASKTSVDERE